MPDGSALGVHRIIDELSDLTVVHDQGARVRLVEVGNHAADSDRIAARAFVLRERANGGDVGQQRQIAVLTRGGLRETERHQRHGDGKPAHSGRILAPSGGRVQSGFRLWAFGFGLSALGFGLLVLRASGFRRWAKR